MTALALYRKWRPRRWEEVIGQPHVIQTLRNAVASGRVAHAYLFAGPRGTGKTTAARILAKAVNCLDEDLSKRPCEQCDHCKAVNEGRFLDLIEIDAASNTSVEDVRDLRDKINFSPNQGRYKVYIIDEVHMLSTAAFNALLKTLEEPPPHAIFILATTEMHKIPATVLSRCQRHEFRRISVNEIVTHLKNIATAEGLQADESALTLVARQATGSVRDAISLLDQLASSGKTITLELAQSVLGTAPHQAVLQVVEAIQKRQSAEALDEIHRALDGGSDPRQFARQVVDYLRNLILVRMGNADQVDATPELRAQMARHAQGFDLAELLRLIRIFNQAANEARNTWQPSLPLEMALIEALTGAEQDKEPSLAMASQADRSPLSQRAVQPSSRATETPAEQAPVESQAAPSSLEDDLLLKQIHEHWREILMAVRSQDMKTEALLKSGKLLGVKHGTVFFGFSETLKTKMERDENLALVQRAFEQVLKQDVSLRCVVYMGKGGALPPDLESDGMVATALRDLGGEIVDMQ